MFQCGRVVTMAAHLIPKTALVLGDGLAANLLSCVLLRHDIAVTLIGKTVGTTYAGNVHVHSVSTTTTDDFVALCGAPLAGFESGDAVSIDGHFGVDFLPPRLVTHPAHLLASIQKRADHLGVVRVSATSLDTWLTATGAMWHLRMDRTGIQSADLLVDATGASRAMCDILERLNADPIFIDEGGPPSFYQTFVGDGPGDLEPLTIVVRVPDAKTNRAIEGLMAFHRAGSVHLTLKSQAPIKASVEAVIVPLLTLGLRGIPPHVLTRLAAVVWADGSTSYASAGARQLVLEEANLEHLPPCFAIGDALVQTPPSQGQGLAQLAAQLGIIDVALAYGDGLTQIKNRLGNHAHAAWLAATMRATAPALHPVQLKNGHAPMKLGANI